MERINAYTSDNGDGSMQVDVEGMTVDLVTILKAGGCTREQFLSESARIWDEVRVETVLPNEVN